VNSPKLHNDMVTELEPRAAGMDWRTKNYAPGTVELMARAEPGSKAEALHKALKERMEQDSKPKVEYEDTDATTCYEDVMNMDHTSPDDPDYISIE
jgi:hypothetical protein